MLSIYSTILGLISYTPPSFIPRFEPFAIVRSGWPRPGMDERVG